MVEVSDITLIECENNYDNVKKVMLKESNGNWMIKTKVNIVTQFIASEGTLHLWNDGKVVIVATNHPVSVGVPDQDLKELSEWCRQNKWSGLHIHDNLLLDRRARDYWKNIYLAGVIQSGILKELEEGEMDRLSKAYMKEQEEDDGS